MSPINSSKIDQLSEFCNQFLQEISTPEAKELISQVGKIAHNLIEMNDKQIGLMFFDYTSNHGSHEKLMRIRSLLLDIIDDYPMSVEEFKHLPDLNKKVDAYSTSFEDLVMGLKNGSLPQPKISFSVPRKVTIVKKLSPQLLDKCNNDEADAYTSTWLNNKAIIIEPSVYPACASLFYCHNFSSLTSDYVHDRRVQNQINQFCHVLNERLTSDTKQYVEISTGPFGNWKSRNYVSVIKYNCYRLVLSPPVNEEQHKNMSLAFEKMWTQNKINPNNTEGLKDIARQVAKMIDSQS